MKGVPSIPVISGPSSLSAQQDQQGLHQLSSILCQSRIATSSVAPWLWKPGPVISTASFGLGLFGLLPCKSWANKSYKSEFHSHQQPAAIKSQDQRDPKRGPVLKQVPFWGPLLSFISGSSWIIEPNLTNLCDSAARTLSDFIIIQYRIILQQSYIKHHKATNNIRMIFRVELCCAIGYWLQAPPPPSPIGLGASGQENLVARTIWHILG